MKISVSLPDEDVAFLHSVVAGEGAASRSAVLHRAVTMLRSGDLVCAYEDAFSEWASGGEADAWDATAGDGLAEVG